MAEISRSFVINALGELQGIVPLGGRFAVTAIKVSYSGTVPCWGIVAVGCGGTANTGLTNATATYPVTSGATQDGKTDECGIGINGGTPGGGIVVTVFTA